jgi:hypothetical protein
MRNFILLTICLFLSSCTTATQSINKLIDKNNAAIANTQKAVTYKDLSAAAIQGKEADYNYQIQYSLLRKYDRLAMVFAKLQSQLTGPNITTTDKLEDMVNKMIANQKNELDLLRLENKQIATLQKSKNDADKKYADALAALNAANTKLDKQALANAKTTDLLNSYENWFGIPGLFHYGFKAFISLIVIGVIIVGLILVLHYASMGSPAAAAVLSIVEQGVAVPIKLVGQILPNAVKLAGSAIETATSKATAALEQPNNNA